MCIIRATAASSLVVSKAKRHGPRSIGCPPVRLFIERLRLDAAVGIAQQCRGFVIVAQDVLLKRDRQRRQILVTEYDCRREVPIERERPSLQTWDEAERAVHR